MNAFRATARTLVRGAGWNLLGQALPVVSALVLIPHLVRGLGIERFGILSLAWMLVGYFSFFDLGIGGAMTQIVSERCATGREKEVPPLVWTSMSLTFALGALGAFGVALLTPWTVDYLLRVPPLLQPETRGMLFVLAMSLPLVTTTAALVGTLAAHHQFAAVNAIRIPLGVFTFAGPAVAMFWSRQLDAIAVVLVGGRAVAAIALLCVCLRVVPGLRRRIDFRAGLIAPLVRFGSWMTVSALVGPFMVYFDRFLIGALLSMAMVAYYTTPYDVSTRLWILSQPIVAVLFPAISASFSEDHARARRLFDWGLRAVAVAVFPVAFVLVVFAREGLGIWLGPEFANKSARTLQWLAPGVFVNALGQMALAVVQGAGRPDLSARLHVVELPAYLLLLFWLVPMEGIQGAAIAWTLRVTADALILLLLARRLLGGAMPAFRVVVAAAALAVAAMVVGAWLPGLRARVVYGCAVAAVFLPATYFSVVRVAARALGRATEASRL